MSNPMAPIVPARVAFDVDTPVSTEFGDSYFMPGQGLAESETVFIQACRLPERFSSLRVGGLLVVGETGFGSGLNCLLAARAFQQHAAAGARLQLISAELHPLTRADLEQALNQWPELADLSGRLLAGYPPPTPGYHRLQLTDQVDLTLMFGDATAFWQQCQARVDAWFLDGFAPAKNPAMWNETLYRALARCSRPGATLATFSAAGHVRRGLESAGFEVRRHAGFANKRHRLTAIWPGCFQVQRVITGHALVAGAGLAGATTARALAERGWRVSVCDPTGIAGGASGNLAGVVYSTPSSHLSTQNRFYQLALGHAFRWFAKLGFPDRPEHGCLNDVIQIPVDDRAREKLSQAMSRGAWPTELLEQDGGGNFILRGAGFISPAAWCRHLLDHPQILIQRVALSNFLPGHPVAVSLDDGSRCEVDALILCLAEAAGQLPDLGWLPLKLIRGQVSYCAATEASRQWPQAICHAGYLTPALDGAHCVGATFDLHSRHADLTDNDDRANLAQLRTYLPEHWQALGGERIKIVGRRAALRCQSTDFLPLAGPLPAPESNPHQFKPGIWLNLAHGSRGITHTPLCAQLIADQLSQMPLPADPAIVAALAPERFILRRRRRDPAWSPD